MELFKFLIYISKFKLIFTEMNNFILFSNINDSIKLHFCSKPWKLFQAMKETFSKEH